MAMKDAEKNMAMSQKLADQYKLGDACENAFTAWKAKLDFISLKSLKADEQLYEAVANAFYGAGSQAALGALMDKTAEELAEIGRGGGQDG